ncbi:hypothetical protein AGLY_011142 [Aphis glycines]|uniref:Uncharacterized protein n=1 Tax=Aphis glycines TaxID=307491 RepID=A0A6G0TCK5_APHGL|nr:hypothetical protein AGLY_011142 [Aphis glycines]
MIKVNSAICNYENKVYKLGWSKYSSCDIQFENNNKSYCSNNNKFVVTLILPSRALTTRKKLKHIINDKIFNENQQSEFKHYYKILYFNSINLRKQINTFNLMNKIQKKQYLLIYTFITCNYYCFQVHFRYYYSTDLVFLNEHRLMNKSLVQKQMDILMIRQLRHIWTITRMWKCFRISISIKITRLINAVIGCLDRGSLSAAILKSKYKGNTIIYSGGGGAMY